MQEDQEDKEFTRKFLELLSVYCDVMQEYPDLLMKLEGLMAIVRSKEQTITSLRQLNEKVTKENEELLEFKKKRELQLKYLEDQVSLEKEAYQAQSDKLSQVTK